MPVTFLSKQHRRRYGRYTGEPKGEQLARYFHLDDVDLDYIGRLRPARNRLDFSLQLCTVRFLGTFLDQPTGIPTRVVSHVAAQLDITNPSVLQRHATEQTRRRHAREIKVHYGYRDFSDAGEGFRLVRWLYTRAWMSEERPSVLFDLATARLVERKVLLPGATTLERVIARLTAYGNVSSHRYLKQHWRHSSSCWRSVEMSARVPSTNYAKGRHASAARRWPKQWSASTRYAHSPMMPSVCRGFRPIGFERWRSKHRK